MDYLLEPFKMAAAAVGLRQRSGPVSPRAPPPKRSREEGVSKRTQPRPTDQQEKYKKRRRKAEKEDSVAAIKAQMEDQVRRGRRRRELWRQIGIECPNMQLEGGPPTVEDLEDMLIRCREEKAEERGLRERLGREGYKQEVLEEASLPDLRYYVSRESWGHPERDPNYPSGRVERQAYVQQLHEEGFDDWGELTPANLAKPQIDKDGRNIYRDLKKTWEERGRPDPRAIPEFIGGKRRAKSRRSSSKRRRTKRRRTKRRRKKSRKRRKKRRTRRR